MSTAPISTQTPNPAAIFETINAYQRSAALKAAIELDVFSSISNGERTAQDLAGRMGATARAVRILCDYLVIIGLLEKHGDQYSLTPDSAMFLDSNSPACIATATRFLLDPRMTAPFTDLAQVIRSGKPGEGVISRENPIWVDFAWHMAPMSFRSAQSVAEIVAGIEPARVLDIAAGHGLYGISVAQKNPQAHITALDWPDVLAVARENARRFGVADRHSTIEGDAFEVDLGGPYDMVLVTGFFHHFDQQTCERLAGKVLAALAPQGRCVTVDFVPNDDRVTPPTAAGFAMMMLAETPAGDAYTFAEYESVFRNAGFSSSSHHPLPGSPLSVIVSRKA